MLWPDAIKVGGWSLFSVPSSSGTYSPKIQKLSQYDRIRHHSSVSCKVARFEVTKRIK